MGELVERPPGNLEHAVVQRRLESSSSLFRNSVLNLIQCPAHGYFGGNPAYRLTRALARQGRATADSRVNLDYVVR